MVRLASRVLKAAQLRRAFAGDVVVGMLVWAAGQLAPAYSRRCCKWGSQPKVQRPQPCVRGEVSVGVPSCCWQAGALAGSGAAT